MRPLDGTSHETRSAGWARRSADAPRGATPVTDEPGEAPRNGSTLSQAVTEQFLTGAQLAALLGRRPQTIRAWRLRGHGPRYIRLGDRLKAPVAYRLSDIEDWLAARTFQNTAEEER